jgi:hypothetical protein
MKWTHVDPGISPLLVGFDDRQFARLDPHLIWASLTYLRDADKPTAPVPVMFEARRSGGHVQLPSSVNLVPGTAHLFSPFFTGFVQLRNLLSFANEVERFRIGIVSRPMTRQGSRQPPAMSVPLHPRRDEVVIGVIDHGIAFANKQFAFRDGRGQWCSRIERIWDQQRGYPSRPGMLPRELWDSPDRALYRSNFWKAVPCYGYGRELANAAARPSIDFWLNRPFTEAQLYRHLDYLPVQHARAHGTHVLGLAAGVQSHAFGGRAAKPVEEIRDAASRARIIAVQLPALPYKDTSGTGLSVQILDAVSYIAFHAAGRKFVINLSDGAYAGPHDGNSLLERALDGFFSPGDGRRAFVVAAGNQFDERVHWQSQVPANGGETELSWRILPDDSSDSHLEIWPTQGSPVGELHVCVTPPGGGPTEFVSLGGRLALHADAAPGAPALAAIIFSSDPPNAGPAGPAGPRAMVHVAVGGTRPARSSLAATAPHGVWKVRLKNTGGTPIAFDAYIERDNPALGDHGPRRQSHFVHPGYPRAGRTRLAPVDDSDHQSPIRRMGALNNVACARSVLVVGGYVFQTGQLSSYTASGPGRAIAGNAGVDVLAVCDGSQAIRGVRGCAVRTGTTFRMDGTSVAAPQVTRWVANWMASKPQAATGWGPVVGPYASAANPALRGPADRMGLGRLGAWAAAPAAPAAVTTAPASPATK